MRCVVCGVGGWDPFVWGCVFRCAFATTSDIPDESSISLFLVMYHSVTFGCQLLFLAVKLSDAFFDVCCAIISIREFDASMFESFLCCQIAFTTFLSVYWQLVKWYHLFEHGLRFL